MSDTQGYKITIKTANVALSALYHHRITLHDWLKMEMMEDRLRAHLQKELDEVEVAIKELRAL